MVSSGAAFDLAGCGIAPSLVRASPSPIARAVVNAAGAWQEVEEKCGYDKTWEWHGQTALAKACSQKRHAVVHYLLSVGADPYLKAMVHCDQSENAFESAKYCPISTALLQAAKPFWAGSNVSPSYSRRLTYRVPTDAAALRRALDKVYAPHLARRSRPAAYDDEDDDDEEDDDDDDKDEDEDGEDEDEDEDDEDEDEDLEALTRDSAINIR